ncbi:MAG TPA: radical SAM protein [Thermotogota bacterium]|nr:radical SAM protein [Thermotogota bacterium]
MFHRRYRSHHDAEFALRKFLGIEKRRGERIAEEKVFEMLNSRPVKDERVIYFHVPYCDRLCSFCNLNRRFCSGSEGEKNETLEKYTDYLCDEIKKYSRFKYIQSEPFSVIYFGGGTPTIFSTSQLKRILDAINTSLPLYEHCEFTFETTLHNLNAEKVAMMMDRGVNRLSVGIQTFNDNGRSVLNRSFDNEETVKRLKILRAQFDRTLCIDIIYSYPGQSMQNIHNDASSIIECDVDSVSFYSLMLHDESALTRQIQNGQVVFDRTLESDNLYHNRFYQSLTEKGFKMLELSKLVKPGRDEYRYIKLRYRNADVLPLGVGAGGRLGDMSIYRMTPEMSMYGNANPEFDFFHELLGTMQYGQYDLNAYREMLNEEEYVAFEERFENLNEKGFFIQKGDQLYELSVEGVFWGNNIAIELMKSIIGIRRPESSFNFEGVEDQHASENRHPLRHPEGMAHPSRMPVSGIKR